MKKRILKLLCILAALLLLFCACSNNVETNDEEETEAAADETEATAPEATQPENTPPAGDNTADIPGTTTSDRLEKLLTLDATLYTFLDSGVAYKDSETGSYGILSMDGKNDTGAIYYRVEALRGTFKVTMEWPSKPEDIEAVNKTGVVDGNGKVLIPAEYAMVNDIGSDRFFKVIKAIEITDDKDEALMYMTSSMFSIDAKEGDTLYKGVWYIYDIQKGCVVNNVSATNNRSVAINGDLIQYVTDEGETVKVNTEGNPFPEDSESISWGYYYMDADKAVYDAFGKKLFDYDRNSSGYIYYRENANRFVTSNFSAGTTEYKILDISGKILVDGLTHSPTLYGENMYTVDNTLYDYNGNVVVSEEVTGVSKYGDIWYVSNYETKQFYLLNENLEVLYSGNGNNGESFMGYNVALKKEVNGNELYYSFAQKDFVYEGKEAGCGLLSVENEDGTYNLVDAFTDEVLATGFSRYTLEEGKNGKVYIFAQRGADGRVMFVMN